MVEGTQPGSVHLSVVTPTLGRPQEVADLLGNLAAQDRRPDEVVIVDGAPPTDRATQTVVEQAVANGLPFRVEYLRSARGTALQRNVGIARARGELVALIDDDVRLEPTFLEAVDAVFRSDDEGEVGGVVGYRVNQFLGGSRLPPRWRMYRRFGLLRTFEPGAYDWETGYPINANLQPPFAGTRKVEFMTTACAVWRRAVFDAGLRFDPFFRDYGILEDAHFSLRAGQRWTLLQCGDAWCRELSAPGGRSSAQIIGQKSVVNYWFVFNSVAGPLRPSQRWRFWQFQAAELVRVGTYLAVHPSRSGLSGLLGRCQGIGAVLRGDVRQALRDRTDR